MDKFPRTDSRFNHEYNNGSLLATSQLLDEETRVTSKPKRHTFMLKIIPLLVLIILGAISLPMEPATVSSQNGEVVGFYRNTTEGFSIRLPQGWLGQENDNNFPLLSVETKSETYPAYADVWVYLRVGDVSAEAWFNSQIMQFQPETTHRGGRFSLPGADSAFQSLAGC